MFDRWRLASAVAVLIALATCLDSFAEVWDIGRSSTATSEIQALDFLSLQARRVIANVLWLRVDDYLHAGDIVKPKKAGSGEGSRGGVSLRASAPELYPLARLVTVLDPTFITAGVVIGGVMMKENGMNDAGTTFLRGLIRGNPYHPRLYALYSIIGASRWSRDDFQGSIPYLRRALQLFPRVDDADALARFGDTPRTATDDLDYRGIVSRLCHALVIMESYPEALKVWKLSSDFDPRNKIVKVLTLYRRMEQEGKVDRDELALYFQKLRREEQEEAIRIGKEKAALPDPTGQRVPPPENGLTKMAQPAMKVYLDVAADFGLKLGVLLVITFAVVCWGSLRGWLSR